MNWHDTIIAIRKDPKYASLVVNAYFDQDLPANVERFSKGEEFLETLRIIEQYAPTAVKLLDIGAGNGISSVNFARKGYEVTVVEPDPSDTVGAGAIHFLKEHYQLDKLDIYECFAEEIGFKEGTFDIVYVRQAMHHAYDLNKFIKECGRVLKPGGILLTIRDHVVFNQKDKEWFLQMHPLHKYYGGENAFSPAEYRNAMKAAGLTVIKELRFYDSVINYFPMSSDYVHNFKKNRRAELKAALQKRIGKLALLPGVFPLYAFLKKKHTDMNELYAPGRMYSYIAIKN